MLRQATVRRDEGRYVINAHAVRCHATRVAGSHLEVTFGCWNHGRARASADGSMQPVGVEVSALDLPGEVTSFRRPRTLHR